MARYIKAVECADIISERFNILLSDLVDVFAEIPTADVVPKSEVEKLKQDLEIAEIAIENRNIELEGMRTAANSYKMHYDNLAREIFEEIERFLYLHFRFCKEEIGNDDTEYVKGRLELNTQIQNFIAELKKKYAEGCTTCAHMVSCEPNPLGTCEEYERIGK